MTQVVDDLIAVLVREVAQHIAINFDARLMALEMKVSNTLDNTPAILGNIDVRLNNIERDLDFGNGPSEPKTLWDQVQKCVQWINDQRIHDAHEALSDRMQRLEDKFEQLSGASEDRINELISNYVYNNEILSKDGVRDVIHEVVENLSFEVRVS